MDKGTILKDMKKILLIQLGDIGDVVWMMPTVRAIKETVPGSRIYLLLREGTGSLLEDDPWIERVFEVKSDKKENLLDRAAGQIRFLKEFRSPEYDMAIDMRSGDRGAFMAFLSGARIRVTQAWQDVPVWRKFLFTHVVHGRHLAERSRGATEQTLCIVRELGIDTDNVTPRLHVSEKNRARAFEILTKAGISPESGWVTLNPFSRWSYKEWSRSKWAEVIDWLWAKRKIASVLIGSQSERLNAEELVRLCSARVYNLAGQTTLAELASILQLSPLHVGVDSAAPHIAAAVGTPTITIYGPSSWKEWGPIGHEHRFIYPELECAPCHQKGCDGGGQSRCLEELEPDTVKAVIEEVLSRQ
jgi:predicted lipopolysaccharide heptosyltransferase III